jgi:hypothetical protein
LTAPARQNFLALTAEGWRDWSTAIREGLANLPHRTPDVVAPAIAESLAARPLLCDRTRILTALLRGLCATTHPPHTHRP